MAVFTLPAFNLVFKIIKDSFGAPKNTTRQAVMDKYHFVFVRDRVGRLADAQEFEHLEFPRRCFPDDLLAYLLAVAGETVRVEGDRVIVRHVYTERRVTPLNLFLRDAEPGAAREAVIEYGNAIKDLAAADIFTGDMLLKNFGVTRNGRVICYDYDELCLLSECRFRRIPPPTSIEEEFAAEPWFYVGEQDVFPGGVPGLPGPAGRACGTPSSRRTATCWTSSSGSGCSAGWPQGEVVDVLPLPPERACSSGPSAGPGLALEPGQALGGGQDPPDVRRRRPRAPGARAARRRGCRARRNRARWSACRRRAPPPSTRTGRPPTRDRPARRRSRPPNSRTPRWPSTSRLCSRARACSSAR